jgi:hypothetical protein
MLLPENDLVLANVLPKCIGLNNITTTIAIAKANALWLFAMLLMYRFGSPSISSHKIYLRSFTTLGKNLGNRADIFQLQYNH